MYQGRRHKVRQVVIWRHVFDSRRRVKSRNHFSGTRDPVNYCQDFAWPTNRKTEINRFYYYFFCSSQIDGYIFPQKNKICHYQFIKLNSPPPFPLNDQTFIPENHSSLTQPHILFLFPSVLRIDSSQLATLTI